MPSSNIFSAAQAPKYSGTLIQTLNYSTSDLAEADRFKFWQDLLSCLFKVTMPFHRRKHGFFASLTVYHLGLALVLHGKSDLARYTRSALKVRHDDLDHFVIHICTHGGGFLRRSGQKHLHRLDVGIVDLASPLDFVSHPGESVSLVLPRSLLSPAMGGSGSPHGRILAGDTAIGALLGQHITTLCQQAPRLWLHEAAALTRVTATLADACLAIGTVAPPATAGDLHHGLVRAIRRHIEERLHQSDLAPEALATEFHISRSQLYRLFEALGGVHHYIRLRRLRRAMLDICSPTLRHRRIGDIGYDLGFRNEAHFGRIFHETFGVSPRAARQAFHRGEAEWLAVPELPSGRNKLEHWLRELMAV